MSPAISQMISQAPPATGVGSSIKGWKRRYFVLRGAGLEYYSDQRGTKLKGVIDLSLVTSVVPSVSSVRTAP